MLRRILENLDNLPDGHADFYKKGEDGKYHLQVDADPAASEAERLRKHNERLLADVKAAEAAASRYSALGDIDEDGINTLLEARKRVQALEADAEMATLLNEKGSIDPERVNAYAERLNAEKIRDLESQTAAANEREQKAKKEHDAMLEGLIGETRRSAIAAAVNRYANPAPGAMGDIYGRAEREVHYSLNDEGKLVHEIRDAEGNLRYDADSKPMTLDTYAKSLPKDAPYLFVGSRGGSAGGSTAGGGTTGGTGGEKDADGRTIVQAWDSKGIGRRGLDPEFRKNSRMAVGDEIVPKPTGN